MKYIFWFWALTGMFSLFGQEEQKFHEVQAGETKYSISRQYEISIEQLERFNPDIKLGLKAGARLLIPQNLEKDLSREDSLSADGQFLYHYVKKGETLFSLSKDYGASIATIKSLNDGLADGLKEGSWVQIPVVNKDQATPKDTTQFFYHRISAGETAYALSKLYNMSLDSLYALNPEAEDGLKLGGELRIPRKKYEASLRKSEIEKDSMIGPRRPKEQLSSDEKSPKNETDTVQDSDYFLYKVKTGDSFYSFKTKLDVSRAELIELNPELEEGLKVGNYIIVPKKQERAQQNWLERLFTKVEEPEPGPVQDETLRNKELLNRPLPEAEGAAPAVDVDTLDIDTSKTYRVALMLPFSAGAYAVDSVEDFEDLKISPVTEMSLHFYQGFLLAADSMKAEGMKISLKVFDTEQNPSVVKKQISEIRENQMDLVIGPATSRNVQMVAKALEADGIPVISPLSRSTEVKGQPNLIRAVPAQEAEALSYASIINANFSTAEIVFAHSATDREMAMLQQIKSRLAPRKRSDFLNKVTITKEDLSSRDNPFKSIERDSVPMVVVVLSESDDFVMDVVRKLSSLDDSSVYLLGDASLKEMATVEYEYLSKLRLTMPMVRFVNYGDPQIQNFVARYRDRYQVEPSAFAFQGYDIGFYFLSELRRAGVYLPAALGGEQELISTGYRWQRQKNGGTVNQYLLVTGIRNMTLVRIPLKENQPLQQIEQRQY